MEIVNLPSVKRLAYNGLVRPVSKFALSVFLTIFVWNAAIWSVQTFGGDISLAVRVANVVALFTVLFLCGFRFVEPFNIVLIFFAIGTVCCLRFLAIPILIAVFFVVYHARRRKLSIRAGREKNPEIYSHLD